MADDRVDDGVDEMRALFERGAGSVNWEELPPEVWQYAIYESTANIADFTAGDLIALVRTSSRMRDALLRPGDQIDYAKARSLLPLEDNIEDNEYMALRMGMVSGRYDPEDLYTALGEADNTGELVPGSALYNQLKSLVAELLDRGVKQTYKGLILALTLQDDDLTTLHQDVSLEEGPAGDSDDDNALRVAIQGDYVFGMKVLLAHPEVYEMDLNGFHDPEPLLIDAMEYEAWEVALLLIAEPRTDMRAQDMNAYTPWEYALKHFPPYAVMQALASHPDIDPTAPLEGLQPFVLALLYGLESFPANASGFEPLSMATLAAVSEAPLCDKLRFMMDTVGPEVIRTYVLLRDPDIMSTQLVYRPTTSNRAALRTAFFIGAVVGEANRRIEDAAGGQRLPR